MPPNDIIIHDLNHKINTFFAKISIFLTQCPAGDQHDREGPAERYPTVLFAVLKVLHHCRINLIQFIEDKNTGISIRNGIGIMRYIALMASTALSVCRTASPL